MRPRTFALLLVLLVAERAVGDDLLPDWLPSPAPPKDIWDLNHEQPVSRPGEEFSDLLLRVAGNPGVTSRVDSDRFKLSQESSTNLGKVSSSLDLPDPRDPRTLPYRDWKTTHALNMPLVGFESIFMFSNVDSSGDSLDHQMINMKSRTGFGWKWSPFGGSELQLKTGTVMTYADTLSSTARSQERSQLSVALQAKLDLFGPLQLQYSGEALPAMAQSGRTLLTDVKLAMPLGSNQEMYLGAKYKWEDSLAPTPWLDRAQLYMGLKFQR
jgi:hypothetical protein